MQTLFQWKDYHLHEVMLFEGEKPLVYLVLDEEMVYDMAPMKAEIEAGILLSKYLPKCKKLAYAYDFGDNWMHHITVDKVLFDYDKNYAVCLDGAGIAPPSQGIWRSKTTQITLHMTRCADGLSPNGTPSLTWST